jgi:hypothetical protein
MTLVIDYSLLASLSADSEAPSPVHVPTGEPAAPTGQTTAPAPTTP